MRRNQYLDILRGLAILLVLGRHLKLCPAEQNELLHQLSRFWIKIGWVGVDLFFVLSGFLVSGLIFKEHLRGPRVRLGRFLLRRGFRIYPSFLFTVTFTALTLLWTNGRVPWPKLLADLTFTQNIFGGLWIQNWSLAVEEHFYLLLALFCWLMQRDSAGFDNIPKLFAFFGLGCLALRLYTNLSFTYLMHSHFCATYLRLDSLMFGVFLSWLCHYHNLTVWLAQGNRRLYLTGIGVLLLLPVGFSEADEFPMLTWGFTTTYVGFGLVMVCHIHFSSRLWPFQTLALVGTWSYPIYLWHMVVQEWAVPAGLGWFSLSVNWYAYAVAYVGGSVLAGYLATRALDEPFMKLRERWVP